jgi:hypothetical protein
VKSTHPPTLIDTVRATITVLSDVSGIPESEIFCYATDKDSQSEMAGLTWRLIESAGQATAGEICRLFGQEEDVVFCSLIKHDDPELFFSLLNQITELITQQSIDRKPRKSKYWKRRAAVAEKKLKVANLELSHIRQIAEQGGSWELIEKYLDETGAGHG